MVIIGAGLCGLTTAITVAQRGLRVTCVADGRQAASVANFGQLHSGAVYAPILPEVTAACWAHRHRWHDYVRDIHTSAKPGLALFHDTGAVDPYADAWGQLGIVVTETDPTVAGCWPTPAAAFQIPDISVDLASLYAKVLAHATSLGVTVIARPAPTRLQHDPDTGRVQAGDGGPDADIVVVAAGAGTPALLSDAGLAHTVHTRRVASARTSHQLADRIMYWLDGDLLAVSPTRYGSRVGLPGIGGRYGSDQVESDRLTAALEAHRMIGRHHFTLDWGTVCEPATPYADPSGLVIDLRTPPPGWTPAGNALVALPGKWTTTWHCADQVVDAILTQR